MRLIPTFLIAMSLAGAAQAQPAAPVNAPIATATNSGKPVPAVSKRRPAIDMPAPVPEPHTFVMLMLGLVALGVASRRRESTKKFSE